MSEELKEILDALDYNNDIDLADIKRYPLSLTTKQQHILFDYVTNLQERIDKAIEYIKENYMLKFDEEHPLRMTDKADWEGFLEILGGKE